MSFFEVFVLVVVFLCCLYVSYTGARFVQEVHVRDLEKGAVPAHIIVKDRQGRYAVREIPFTSFISIASRPRDTEVVMDITPEGLSQEKVTDGVVPGHGRSG